MPARIPTLNKSPFAIDPRPLQEMGSAHAGLLATSRALRSLNLGGLVEANLQLKSRQRGFTEGQMIESLVLLQTLGGDCPEDISLLADDQCLSRGLGYQPPKASAVRTFLNRFHDEELSAMRPAREVQKSFIMPRSCPQQGLDQVLSGLVGQVAALFKKHGQEQKIATIDQDATIIESHKKSALCHYEGGRGYQPMVALWSEADLVVASEFRDGNVPARQAPLNCARMAFEALPSGIKQRYFRGDSACHENELIDWLKDPARASESGGRIGFCVSAVMESALSAAVHSVEEKAWKTYATEADGTLRQWAEVSFVPADSYEQKDSLPLRYVGLRLLKAQGVLFADGSDRKHYAVLTNLDWEGGRLLNWHREKAGTVEHTHDEIKNALGGGHMPSQKLAVNAAWFTIALLAYNVASAIKSLCLDPEERTARFKRYRLLLVHIAGRMSRFQCKLRLRLQASAKTIARIQKIWDVFDLPTQATAFS
ncbi:MAG: IS1380 family transposase [Pseudohongiellaceae bacterium]